MTDLNKYIALKAALLNEQAKLEARLGEISKALGQDNSVPARAPSAPSSPATTTTPGKRTFSAATKAKMAAAQKARWAVRKGNVAVAATPATSSAPTPKKKRKMSAAGKANIRAAVKARWAKANALKAKAVGK